MKKIIYIIVAMISLAIALLCFGVLFVSCAGHPPQTFTSILGIWIFPDFLLIAGIFLYVSMFYWVAVIQPGKQMDIEAKSLPKKIIIFFVSFVAACISFYIFSFRTLFLAINSKLPNWTGIIAQGLFAGAAIYIGFTTYKRMNKYVFNNGVERDAKKPGGLNG